MPNFLNFFFFSIYYIVTMSASKNWPGMFVYGQKYLVLLIQCFKGVMEEEIFIKYNQEIIMLFKEFLCHYY